MKVPVCAGVVWVVVRGARSRACGRVAVQWAFPNSARGGMAPGGRGGEGAVALRSSARSPMGGEAETRPVAPLGYLGFPPRSAARGQAGRTPSLVRLGLADAICRTSFCARASGRLPPMSTADV